MCVKIYVDSRLSHHVMDWRNFSPNQFGDKLCSYNFRQGMISKENYLYSKSNTYSSHTNYRFHYEFS